MTSQNRVFEVRLTRNSILVPLITCSVALDKYLTSVSSSVKQGVIISPSFGLSRVLNEIMYIVGYSKWSVNSSLKKKKNTSSLYHNHYSSTTSSGLPCPSVPWTLKCHLCTPATELVCVPCTVVSPSREGAPETEAGSLPF